MATESAREVHEIYAVRYARNDSRMRNQNFIFDDPHDGPMPLDYFVWAVRNENRTFIVDTGCTARHAAERGATYLRRPAEGLAMIGIDAETVTDVIVTHMHYDHAGGIDDFPNATLHLQDTEMAYATGRCMCFEAIKRPFDVEDVCAMVRRLYAGRVQFHDGDAVLAPGISIHKLGGHSAGLMCVRVWTQRGWVVVASDCTHFYENVRENKPFIICYNLGDMMNGFNTLNILADSPDHIIPGHDPLVREYYPPASESTGTEVVRVDVPPRSL